MSEPTPTPPPLPHLTPPPLPRPAPRPLWREMMDEHDDLEEGDQAGNQKIGGWLILFAIGRVLAPLMLGGALARDLLAFTRPNVWSLLTTPGSSAYHPLWSTIIVYETGTNFLLLVYSIVLVGLFFARWKVFPPLMSAYLVIMPLFYIGDYWIGTRIPAISSHGSGDTIGSAVGGLIGALIWVPYFLTSVRVRHTFVK